MIAFNAPFASDKLPFYSLGSDFSPLSYTVLADVLEARVESIKNVEVVSIRRSLLSRIFFPILLFKNKWRKLKFEANLAELDEIGTQEFECGIKIIKAFEILFIDKCENSDFILELKINLTFEELKIRRSSHLELSWYID